MKPVNVTFKGLRRSCECCLHCTLFNLFPFKEIYCFELLQCVEELTRQRDTLIGEIRLLKEEEEMQKIRLTQKHQRQLKELEEGLHRLHSENMSRSNFISLTLSLACVWQMLH